MDANSNHFSLHYIKKKKWKSSSVILTSITEFSKNKISVKSPFQLAIYHSSVVVRKKEVSFVFAKSTTLERSTMPKVSFSQYVNPLHSIVSLKITYSRWSIVLVLK